MSKEVIAVHNIHPSMLEDKYCSDETDGFLECS